MKKLLSIALLMFMFAFLTACGSSATGPPIGDRITTASDAYGLDQNANKFDGSYFDNYSGRAPYYYGAYANYDGDDAAYLADYPGAASHWAWPYRTTRVLMKYNDAWPNEGGWITNHMWDDGWDYFVKIVWVGPPPSGDDPYAATRIWNDFAIIQEVYNENGGDHGNVPIPGPNGFGAY